MTTGTRPDVEQPRSRGRRILSRANTAAAVGLLLAVLIAGAVMLFAPGRDAPSPAPAPAGQDTASVCGLPDGDQTIPSTTPAGTVWQVIGTMAAPVDPALGPGTGNGVPACYARSPMGVLYAAANFSAVCTDPALRMAAARSLTAAGPGRDRMIATLQASGVGGAGTADLQIAGFRFVNFDPASASVDLAYRYGTQYVHIAFGLSWEAGDWKIVVPDDGLPLNHFERLDDLGDFVPWAGR